MHPNAPVHLGLLRPQVVRGQTVQILAQGVFHQGQSRSRQQSLRRDPENIRQFA